MLIELAALAYCADKSNKMDAQALAKRSKAFTKEAEARDLVYQKRSTAEKKMQNVAKKKRAIIESTLPRFVEVYQKIQKIDLTISDKNELAVYNQFQKSNAIQAMQVVIQKPLTDGQLITEYIFKGIGGMMIADSKRNLSAAKSQLSAANVVYSQAQSVAEVYDAIIGRAERIASLLMRMNALFLGSIFETDKGYQQQTPWVGIANTNQKLMLQAAAEFGLTPSARTRIMAAVSADKESEDEMEALLGGDS